MKKVVFMLVSAIVFAIFPLSAEAVGYDGTVYYCETTVADPSPCEAPIGTPPWKTAGIGERPSFSDGTDYVWYAMRLDSSEQDKKSVLFSTTGESVEVCFDGALIYNYGEKRDVLGNNGSRWHFVPFPVTGEGDHWLVTKLYSPVPSRVGSFDWVHYDTEEMQAQRIFLSDTINITSLSIAIGMLVIMFLFMKEGGVEREIYLSTVTFLAAFILWIVSVLNMKYLLFADASSWWCARCLLVCLVAITGNFVLRSVLHGRKKKIVSRIILVYIAIFGVAGGMELMGLHGLDKLFPAVFSVLPVLQIATVLFTVSEAFQGNYYAKGILIPEVVFIALATLDAANIYFHITDWSISFMPAGIFGFVVFIFGILKAQVQREKNMQVRAEHLQKEIDDTNLRASTDPLTGCFNRTNFHELMESAVRDANEKQEPFSLLMFDIDHFKRFNDTYGHDDGDAVLKNFTACIRVMLSETQPFIRYGGEEFVVILPSMNLRKAARLGESIRLRISQARLHDKENVTSSVGVSCWHGCSDTAQDVLRRVDESLYMAKNHGRNRVMTEEMLNG